MRETEAEEPLCALLEDDAELEKHRWCVDAILERRITTAMSDRGSL